MDEVDMATGDAVAYCPRCDRPFMGADQRTAMALMDAHQKRAHAEYYAEQKS